MPFKAGIEVPYLYMVRGCRNEMFLRLNEMNAAFDKDIASE